MNPVTPGPTHPPDPGKWRGTEPDTPIAVPPDKAPLRQQGDLLGTLATLQETYGELWLTADITETASLEVHALIAGLIATAVQQAEALPKPEGDLAAWREKMAGYISDIIPVIQQPLVVASCVNVLRAHLAAMPTPPDVNAGLLEALKFLYGCAPISKESLNTPYKRALNKAGAAIAAAEALPKPAGDLAAWQAEAARRGTSLAMLGQELAKELAKIEPGTLRGVVLAGQPFVGGLAVFANHLSAMPAPPDVNATVVAALEKRSRERHSEQHKGISWEHCPLDATDRAAIAAAEEGAPR